MSHNRIHAFVTSDKSSHSGQQVADEDNGGEFVKDSYVLAKGVVSIARNSEMLK